MRSWPSAPLLADVQGFVFDPNWTAGNAPLQPIRVYRDELDRIQIGPAPAREVSDPHPLVWVGHNQ